MIQHHFINHVEIALKICTLSTRGQQSGGDNKATLASILRAPVTENTDALRIHGGGIRLQNKECEQLGELLTKCSQHVNTELLGTEETRWERLRTLLQVMWVMCVCGSVCRTRLIISNGSEYLEQSKNGDLCPNSY